MEGMDGALPNELTAQSLAATALTVDPDGDGIVSGRDNCPGVANPDQQDDDGDGFGNPCDPGTTSAPTIAISRPADHGDFAAGADITVSADAADADGTILIVRFLADGHHIGAARTAPYTIDWQNVAPGKYQIVAQATDDQAASTTSAPISVTVHGADLAVSQSVAGTGRWGVSLVHTIVAANAGPDAVADAIVTDAFPTVLNGVRWTCTATAGSSCPSAGSGNISARVGLLAGGSVTFVATSTVAVGTKAVTNNVSIVHPTAGQELATWNNVATTTTVSGEGS